MAKAYPATYQSSAATEQEQRRGSERVLLKIPIRVQGTDTQSRPFEEDTATLVINRNGARITLTHSVRVDSRVNITNLRNSVTSPFRLARPSGNSMGDVPEWNVECLEPERNIWGISFPENVAGKVEPLADQIPLDVPVEAPSPPQSKVNERAAGQPYGPRERRITIKLPVRIRARDNEEEITRTENLSKTGVCFVSQQDLNLGETLLLTVDYDPGRNETMISGRVVWRRPQPASSSFVYGVHLEKQV